MKRSKVALVGLVAMAGMAACDDSTGPGPDSSLTEAEAAAMAEIFLGQTFAAGQHGVMGQQVGTPLLAAAVVQVENELEITLPCPLGGSVLSNRTLSGTVDQESGALDMQFRLVQTHQACVVQPPDSEVRFTLDGAPDLTGAYSLALDGMGGYQADGTLAGAVAWAAEDRSGTCEVSLSFSGSGQAQGAFSLSLSGRVCDTTISHEVSVTP